MYTCLNPGTNFSWGKQSLTNQIIFQETGLFFVEIYKNGLPEASERFHVIIVDYIGKLVCPRKPPWNPERNGRPEHVILKIGVTVIRNSKIVISC